MENYSGASDGNGATDNGHTVSKQTPYQAGFKASLPWFDLRVFYVRVSKCEIDDSTPEYLSVNHIPLYHDTLLEVNGVRTGINSDGAAALLRRDRLDKKSEEATFVSTDSIRMTGSVKFEIFSKEILLLSGTLELCASNGFNGESQNHGQQWSMNCETETDTTAGTGFLKAKQITRPESALPEMEVFIAGSFSGSLIILTKTLQIPSCKNQMKKGTLDSISENEATESSETGSSRPPLQLSEYDNDKPDNKASKLLYTGMEYLEGEDEELSWFNAGVRVGVGIGLSICVGLGIGAGLLIRTYQGTTRNFRRHLL